MNAMVSACCWVLALATVASGTAQGANPAGAASNEPAVGRYDVFEAAMNGSKSYANPFLDVTVTATFTAPSRRKLRAYAFHDGGNTWRVRLAPDELGEWHYVTQASDTADGGLHNQTGTFRCARSSNQGFIRADPKHPYYFAFSDGTPFFALGDTCSVTSKGLSDANRKAYLDGRAGKPFNFLRMFASLTFNAWTGKPWSEAIARDGDGFPWAGTPAVPDYDRLNPAYFQRYEKILGELEQSGVRSEIIVFNLYELPFKDPALWTPAREELWGRYVVSRLSAYSTVFLWTVAQEYERYPKGRYRHEPADDDWVRRMASLIRETDPHGHPVTVHPWGRSAGTNYEDVVENGGIGARFRQGADLDVLSHQCNSYRTATWVPSPAPGYWDGPATGVEKAVWADRTFGKPIINTEYGYEWLKDYGVHFNMQAHGTDKCRRAAWRVFMAGGAGMAAGFSGTFLGLDNAEIYYDGKQRFAPFRVADSGHVKQLQHLYGFITNCTDFRELNPAQTLVNPPNLCLANPGREYVVYAPEGGEVRLDLARDTGNFSVTRLDPRTGAYEELAAVSGGEKQVFLAPDDKDWVLQVRKTPSSSRFGGHGPGDGGVPRDNPLDAAFALIRDAVEKGEVPGAIALVAHRGRIVRQEAYGLADPDRQVPFRTNTLCWIASITKPVTVTAAMTLVDEGKIRLDDPVEKYLPQFQGQKCQDDKHYAFTIRHLMTHSSGLVGDPPTRRPSRPLGGALHDAWLTANLPDIVNAIAESRLLFKPGAKVRYSNSAMFVLGRLMEVVSGESYAQLVKQRILDPLGMKDTCYAPPAAEAGRVAAVVVDDAGGRTTIFRFNARMKITNTAPDGGLFSYPAELARFLQLFLDEDQKVLSRASLGEMLREQVPGWGLGWALEEGCFQHGGSSGTGAFADPASGAIGILFFQFHDSKGQVSRLQNEFKQRVRKAFANHPAAV